MSFIKRCHQQPHILYAILALMLGSTLLVIMPPYLVPDESTHFYRAFQVSTGQMVSERNDNKVGGYFPEGIAEFGGESKFYDLINNKQIAPKTILDLWHISLNWENQSFIDFRNVVSYPPLPYLPQALGIVSARIFSDKVMLQFYLGRFSNMLIAIILTATAIWLIPQKKTLIMLLGLTPIYMQEAASLSSDALTNAIALLLISLALNYGCRKQPLAFKQKFWLFTLCLTMCLMKQAYVPLILMIFVIPASQFGSIKSLVKFATLTISVCFMAVLSWNLVAKSIYLPEAWNGGNPDAQILYLLENPLRMLIRMWVFQFKQLELMVFEFIGRMGYLNAPLPSAFINLSWFLILGGTLFSAHPSFMMNAHQRKIMIGIGILTITFMSSMLMICCTPPGGRHILLQGRYFIPIYPLFLLVMDLPLILRYLDRFKLFWQARNQFTLWVPIAYTVVGVTVCYVSLTNKFYN